MWCWAISQISENRLLPYSSHSVVRIWDESSFSKYCSECRLFFLLRELDEPKESLILCVRLIMNNDTTYIRSESTVTVPLVWSTMEITQSQCRLLFHITRYAMTQEDAVKISKLPPTPTSRIAILISTNCIQFKTRRRKNINWITLHLHSLASHQRR